mgnify:FL=1
MLLLAVSAAAAAQGEVLRGVPFEQVRLRDTFWAPRIRLNRETVLPHNFRYCEETGRIRNFDRAAGKLGGDHEGIYYDDSDVYKVIEGAAYSLAAEPDPELEALTDSVIARIAAAQQPDGYLFTYYTIRDELDKRFSDVPRMHEPYCAGHLFEAAVAYHRATGKRELLDVAIRLADHLCDEFGPGRRTQVPGHPEPELALVKLYEETGHQRYLDLATFWINERGVGTDRPLTGDYDQDHKPMRQQSEVVGHAVRAMYVWSGAADVAARIGDPALAAAGDRVWQDVVGRKMYITGGIGPSAHNEGFTVAYDLPNESAYAETCASIGMALWNQRLGLLHGQAKYFDVLERVLYNGLISGVSLSGELFFYVNPLASRGRHHRQAWFGTACCPTNVTRFLPSVGGYQYAQTDDAVYANLYAASDATVELAAGSVQLSQDTNYPWDGRVRLTVREAPGTPFTLALRLPGWARGQAVPTTLYTFAPAPSGAVNVSLNGEQVVPEERDGYARLTRTWRAGDVVELDLPMPVRRVQANAAVEANEGLVALQRGPLVYCLEGVDNPEARYVMLPPEAELTPVAQPRLLGGVTVLRGELPVTTADGGRDMVPVTAVPYYAWDNREPGTMTVWLPVDEQHAPARPVPTPANEAEASSSHLWHLDSHEALADGELPANSRDQSIPRFTWWDRRGSVEWVQYTWDQPRSVSAVSTYWFEDPPNGGCRLPASWRLLYRAGDEWLPVSAQGEYGLAVDAFNRVEFTPVTTDALRIEAQLQPNMSGGLLEWTVE